MIMAVLWSMSKLIHAAPDFSRSFFANQVSLRMTDLTVLSPEKCEWADEAVGAIDAGRYKVVEPASIIQFAETSMYSRSKDGKFSKQLVASCKTWLTKVRWEEPKGDVIGFAPQGVIVVPDDEHESLVWVLHLWEQRAVLLAGRSCGAQMYQIWPGSKEAQIGDSNLVNGLWAAYRDALKQTPVK
jgi:hypothetical protein